MMGDGGTHGAGAGTAGEASVVEVPLGAPEAGTLGVEGGVLMMIVVLEAKEETEESAREKGELS
jgi:hypothetical protein